MRCQLAQLSSAHGGDVIKLRIDEDVAREKQHAVVERRGKRSDIFGTHQGLAKEGEGGISAGCILKAGGLDGEGAVIVLVGGHLKSGEAILCEHVGGGVVDLARIGTEPGRAAQLPSGESSWKKREECLRLRKQRGRGETQSQERDAERPIRRFHGLGTVPPSIRARREGRSFRA